MPKKPARQLDREIGPYTARQAVLSHLAYVKRYPDVYGGPSAKKLYEQAW